MKVPAVQGGLLKGVAALMILAELIDGSKCGYEINSTISRRLGTSLPPGYVYVMLRHLESKGFVKSEPLPNGVRRKRTYSVTEEGLTFLLEHEDKIDRLLSVLSYIKSTMASAKSLSLNRFNSLEA
ncbi:MAG: PadR family transcriptional regulator [Acidilobus sp.]